MSNKINIIRFFFVFLNIFLYGCASDGIHDFNSMVVAQNLVTEPTDKNEYQGLLTETTTSMQGALEKRAAIICSSRGGLKQSPSFAFNNAFYGWKVYRYQCNGNALAQPISIPQAPNSSTEANRSIERNQLQVSPQITPKPNNENQTATTEEPLKMDDAKTKCKDLGFKEKTEKFGKCVLQFLAK